MAMLAIANPVSGDAGFSAAPSYLWASRRATQRLLKVDGDLDVHLASSRHPSRRTLRINPWRGTPGLLPPQRFLPAVGFMRWLDAALRSWGFLFEGHGTDR